VSEVRISISATLDEAAELVARIAAPWVGVLWLTSVPVRLLQAHFAARILELRGEANQYGDLLRWIALLTLAALLLSLVGRAAFVRAAWLGLRSDGSPGREALRVPLGSLLAYAYTALLFEALFYGLGLGCVTLPLCIVSSGLAAAHVPVIERPGLIQPLQAVARAFGQGRVLLGFLFVFLAAFVVAAVNLYFAFEVGLWIAGAVPGLDRSAWIVLLSLSNPRFVLALLAGASLLVEPFWLATLTVFVYRLRSRESGEDLRLWFARLVREAT
jgi:hypothetical protein